MQAPSGADLLAVARTERDGAIAPDLASVTGRSALVELRSIAALSARLGLL